MKRLYLFIILITVLVITGAFLIFVSSKAVDYDVEFKEGVQTARTLQPSQPTEQASSCEGNWINSNLTGKIDLQTISISDWKYESPPAIISETLNSENTVVIGHNYCTAGNCNVPGTIFSQIINMKAGDQASFCLDGKPYVGHVLRCGENKNTDMFLLWNWTGFDSITFFTSYGTCSDSACSTTDKRWVCVIEKY